MIRPGPGEPTGSPVAGGPVPSYREFMRASWKLDRCRRAVERLSAAEPQWDVFSGELIAHLRPAVGFDGWCAALADPATGLPATAVAEDSPVACCQRRFYQLEYQEPDFSTGEALAAGGRPVAVLSDVTRGDLTRSRRWDELLRPAGTSDELRAALEAGGTRWGSLTLYRAAPGRWFSDDEMRLVGSLHGALSRAARAGWAAWPPAPADCAEEPATVLATAAGMIADATPAAGTWLARLGPSPQSGYSLVYALLARLTADTKRHPRGPSCASLVTRTTDGHWAELHAAPLTGTGRPGRHVAVTIGLARPARIRAVLTRAHALSDREGQVARLVLEGRQVADIAAALYISPYTVRDHLKAIYRKTRSHTRHELAARLSGYGPG